MAIPGLLYYLIFHYLPMFGLVIAFKDYNLLKGVWESDWVGLKHFKTIFASYDFSIILKNTVLISLYRILFNMFPDIIFALILNEVRVRWFKRTIQTITYGPYFLSWVIVYSLVFALLSPDAGLLTVLLRELGLGSSDLLINKDFFRPLLIISDIWKNTGFGAILYLASLATINPDLYESAVVDGAGRWRKMWHITLPGIRNIIIMMLILRMGQMLDAGFEQVYIFLNARVYATGDIIDTWVFRRGLENLEFSIASAVGFFKSVVGLVLVLGANKLARKFNGSGLW